MFVAVDVRYVEDEGRAVAVGFLHSSDSDAHFVRQAIVRPVATYIPGKFYLRELPCIVAVIQPLLAEITMVLVDGHCWLTKERPGLGWYLWKHLEGKVPVIGVAKRPFKDGTATPVLRGQSTQPLWVSSEGIDCSQAVAFVRLMHGPTRHPTLLKLADTYTRKEPFVASDTVGGEPLGLRGER